MGTGDYEIHLGETGGYKWGSLFVGADLLVRYFAVAGLAEHGVHAKAVGFMEHIDEKCSTVAFQIDDILQELEPTSEDMRPQNCGLSWKARMQACVPIPWDKQSGAWWDASHDLTGLLKPR